MHKVYGPNLLYREGAAGLPKDVKKLLSTVTVVTLLLAVATLGFAAEDSASVTVGWTVNAKQSLSITSNRSPGSSNQVDSVFQVPEPSEQDLKRGYIKEINAIELVASSNEPWAVQVEAESSSLGRGKDGYEKDVSDLFVRGQGGFRQLSTSPMTIASGPPGEYKFGVDYRVNYSQDYKPGNYEAKLVYTITVA